MDGACTPAHRKPKMTVFLTLTDLHLMLILVYLRYTKNKVEEKKAPEQIF